MFNIIRVTDKSEKLVNAHTDLIKCLDTARYLNRACRSYIPLYVVENSENSERLPVFYQDFILDFYNLACQYFKESGGYYLDFYRYPMTSHILTAQECAKLSRALNVH